MYLLLAGKACKDKCKTFLLKMSFTCMRTKNLFHKSSALSIKSSALSLALKQRLGATGSWPNYLRCLLQAMASRAIIPRWLSMHVVRTAQLFTALTTSYNMIGYVILIESKPKKFIHKRMIRLKIFSDSCVVGLLDSL